MANRQTRRKLHRSRPQGLTRRGQEATTRVREQAMAYFCYIHRERGGVPHFEVLPETSADEAIDQAARLLAQRADGVRAEVWDGEQLVFTLPRETLGRPFAS